MNVTNKLELKLNKKNLKNLTLDEKVIPLSFTDQIGGGLTAAPSNSITKTSLTGTLLNGRK
ncbi:hypothetical protein GCM10009114_13370 [Aliiglaciecola litoralis]|uniref:Uncharacterized protein n=2 Tax=Aliiglaciecola litoralis TaxID=582857 RepID=A0ABN1LF76_9ALTE